MRLPVAEPGINDYNGKPQLVVRELAVKFDECTADRGYIVEMNRRIMAERFLDEIVMREPKECGEAAFAGQRLQAELEAQSRFSLCVEAGTEPALKPAAWY